MPTASPALISFASGEWSPRLANRIDLPKRSQSVRYSQNVLSTVEGPAEKRPGFRYVDDTMGTTARLVPWIRSRSDAVVIEFGNGTFRPIDEDGPLAVIPSNAYDGTALTPSLTGAATLTATETAPGTIYVDADNPGGADAWEYGITLTGLSPSVIYNVTVEVLKVDTSGAPSFDVTGGAATSDALSALPGTWATITVSTVQSTAGGELTVAFASSSAGVSQFYFRRLQVREDTTTTDGLDSPFGIADINRLQWAQSFDVLYLASTAMRPQTLSRFADDDWSIGEAPFSAIPLRTENTIESNTLTASAVSGSITITALDDTVFAGGVWMIAFRSVIESEYKAWADGEAVTAGDYRYAPSNDTPGRTNVYKAGTTGSTGTNAPGHNSGTISDGVVDWQYVHTRYAYAEMQSFSGTTGTFTVVGGGELPQSVLAGTFRWSYGAWSPTLGYPRCVAFFENRLWFAYTESDQYTLWGSAVDDYGNFSPADSLATDAVRYTVNEARNAIAWLSPGSGLEIGTEGAVFVARGGGENDAITPTNVKITREAGIGSEPGQPAQTERGTVFVQNGKTRLRDFIWNGADLQDSGLEISYIARHLSGIGLEGVAYQTQPEQRLWAYDQNGGLYSITYNRQLETIGWGRQPLGGSSAEVKSITVIPDSDGVDRVWAVVHRTAVGFIARTIEVLDGDKWTDFPAYADGYVRKSTPLHTTVSGLAHLRNQRVSIVTDGAIHPDRTVGISGEITLDYESSVTIVGPYSSMVLDPQDIEAGSANGTSQGKSKKIGHLVLRLIDTGPGLLVGRPGSDLDQVPLRSTMDAMDTAVPLYSGDLVVAFPGGWGTREVSGGRIRIEHDKPLPCTVAAIYPQITTNDQR